MHNVVQSGMGHRNVGRVGSKNGHMHKMFTGCEGGQWCVCCKYPSPINLSALLPLLEIYPNKRSARILRDGFSEGFRLGYMGKRESRESHNLKSVTHLQDKAMEKLNKEIELGRIAGPFSSKPLPNLIVSPIGLVPKAEEGKYRLIQHLSYPEGESINDGIDRSYCTVHYASFDEAVKLVVEVGKGAFMAKADVESAFRLLPVHPRDFCLLGMKVNDFYLVDKSLPMGASCSPALFEKFSTFLEWATKRAANSDKISHFADDFIFVGLEDKASPLSCQNLVETFHQVCKNLGVPLAMAKSVGPTSKLVYLGLEIDSIKQVVSIPETKINAIIQKIEDALQHTKVTLKQFQSLIGSLSFVCKAISPGRPFIRRLIDLTCGVVKSWYKIRLTVGAKSDLNMWFLFLKEFNGVSIIPDQVWSTCDELQFSLMQVGE